MLKDYLVQDEFSRVPMSGGNVSVDKTGLIRSLTENITEFRNENNERCITAKLYDGLRTYLVADVVAHSFKPVYIPTKYWNDISVMFLDGNKDNVHPGNLIWKFPIGLGADTHAGYAFIPGYSRYMVNKEGIVLNFLKNTRPTNYIKKYHTYSIIPDNSRRNTTIGKHRLLALAWLVYPPDIDRLDVNHIDGKPGNNVLSNLEWVTRQRNCEHAFEIGLRNDNFGVLVKNVITGEIMEYRSHSLAGKAISSSATSVLRRSKKSGQLSYPGGYLFKRKEDPVPWRNVTDLITEYNRGGIAIPILVRNVITGEITEYSSYEECSTALGRTRDTIRKRVEEPGQLIYSGNLQFKRKYDPTPWREVIKNKENTILTHDSIAIKIRNIFTGKITEYVTLNAAAAAENISYYTLRELVSRKGISLPYLNIDFKEVSDETPWKVYSNEELKRFKIDIERNRPHRPISFKIVDVFTGEETYFDRMSDVVEFTGRSDSAISESTLRGCILNKRWVAYRLC